MVTLESVALVHTDLGPVLPLVPGAKPPATRRGVHAASRDRDQIRSWWSKVPRANVGLATGSGLVVIDLDSKGTERGFVELVSYAHLAGITGTNWLVTYTVTTPNGPGAHLYYSTDREIPNRVRVLPGVDVRGESGYVVAAHSRIDGRKYLPESGYHETITVEPDGTERLESLAPQIASLPDWLEDLVTAKREPAAPVFPDLEIRDHDGQDLGLEDSGPGREIRDLPSYLEAVLLGERHRILSAQPGERNACLNYAAYRLGRHVAAGRLEYDQAEAWLLRTANHIQADPTGERPDPTDAENLATIRSGLRGGMTDA